MKTLLAAGLIALAAACAPAPADATLSLKFAVPPGAQGLKCQTFKNPFGERADVASWSSTFSPAGHHVLVFLVDDPVESGPEDCAAAGGPNERIIYQGQTTGAVDVEYPAGMAVEIGAAQGLMVRVHYLNPMEAEQQVENAITLRRAAEGAVKDRLKPLFFSNLDIRVPAGVPSYTLTKGCTVERDLELVTAVGHLHSHGLELKVEGPAGTIYSTADWHEPPMQVYAQPVSLKAGDEVKFSCTYRGEPDRELRFGDDLERDEMCNVVGNYVARAGDDPGSFFCGTELARAPGACRKCFDLLVSGGDTREACAPSLQAYRDYDACACGAGGCAAECAATACGGKKPDSACFRCIDQKCGAQSNACFSDR